MAFIFIQSQLPASQSAAESGILASLLGQLLGTEPEAVHVFVRKAAHFTEFLVLGICLMTTARDLRATVRGAKYVKDAKDAKDALRCSWMAWAAGTAFALSDEVHQIFVPGRACTFTDVGIDSAGVLTGVLFTLGIWRFRKKCE